jgi:hypothetical protein
VFEQIFRIAPLFQHLDELAQIIERVGAAGRGRGVGLEGGGLVLI